VTTAALLAAGHANAAEPAASITGVEDKALREAIQRAMIEAKAPPRSRSEARRRARDAGDDAVAVLRSEGYYAYVVEPDVSEADPPRAILKINPGPVFVIADPKLAWSGAEPDEGVVKRAESVIRLVPGAPGRAVDVLAAEGRVVSQVQQLGYADAAAEPREVVVDHADHTVRPTFHIAAGDLTHVDGIQVVTQGRSNLDQASGALELGRHLRARRHRRTGAPAARHRRLRHGFGLTGAQGEGAARRLAPGGRDPVRPQGQDGGAGRELFEHRRAGRGRKVDPLQSFPSGRHHDPDGATLQAGQPS
jgi:hypothetical protein